jgi:hypothetical protein
VKEKALEWRRTSAAQGRMAAARNRRIKRGLIAGTCERSIKSFGFLSLSSLLF